MSMDVILLSRPGRLVISSVLIMPLQIQVQLFLEVFVGDEVLMLMVFVQVLAGAQLLRLPLRAAVEAKVNKVVYPLAQSEILEHSYQEPEDV